MEADTYDYAHKTRKFIWRYVLISLDQDATPFDNYALVAL